MPDVALHPFAGCSILARRDSAKLVVLNEAGRTMWTGLASGLAESAVAAILSDEHGIPLAEANAHLAAAIAAWRRDDLIGGDVRERAGDPGAASPVPRMSRPLWSWRGSRRTYALCGRPIAVRFAPRALETLVHPRFAHSEAPRAAPAAVLALVRTRSGFALLEPGRAACRAATAQALLGAFVSRFVELSYPNAHWLAVLHAAAVGDREGRAVVLPGGNGCGKSTLVTGLLAAGYRYLSDDCVPLARDGRVVPVPFAICLKEGSWKVAAPLLPDLGSAPLFHGEDGRRARYVPPGATCREPIAPCALVFPRYEPGGDGRLRPVHPVQALEMLLEGRAWLSQEPGDLRATLALLERLPAYGLAYGAVAQAVAAIRALPPATISRPVRAAAG